MLTYAVWDVGATYISCHPRYVALDVRAGNGARRLPPTHAHSDETPHFLPTSLGNGRLFARTHAIWGLLAGNGGLAGSLDLPFQMEV